MTGQRFTVETFTMPGGTVGYQVTDGPDGRARVDLADALARLSHDIAALWAALDDPAHPCRLGHQECATRPGGACLNAIHADRYAQGVEE